MPRCLRKAGEVYKVWFGSGKNGNEIAKRRQIKGHEEMQEKRKKKSRRRNMPKDTREDEERRKNTT